MARPKKAVVDYFPHYVSHGKTMFTIENKFGNDGYAFWFKTLELLGSSEQHFIDCNDESTWEFLLAKTRLNSVVANEILSLLAKCGAIDADLWSKKIIWSQHFIDNLQTVYIRRKINVYTKEDIEGLCIHKLPLNGVSVNINPQSKGKESKLKKDICANGFKTFWDAYPKKKGKQNALKAWDKFRRSGELPEMDEIVNAIEKQSASRDWQKENGQFIPLPSTWLNGKRWEDEIDCIGYQQQECTVKPLDPNEDIYA